MPEDIIENARKAATGDPDLSEDTDAQVLDPEAYTQKRRQKDIFRIRSEVAEIRLRARSIVADPDVPDRDALTAYRCVLEAYLVEVEPLFLRFEGGTEIWRDTHLGTVTINPPEEATGDDRDLADETPDPATYTFDGLASILEAPNPLMATFDIPESIWHDTHTRTVERRIPIHILDDAYRRTNAFLADIGMDIDPTDDTGEWEV